MSTQGAGWSHTTYFNFWLASLCTFTFSLPTNSPLTDPAESGKESFNRMAVPIAAVCKTALGVHGNSCTLQGCSVFSYVSLAAPHSNSTTTKLCAISAKKCKAVKTERRGQCGSLNELPVYRRATAFNVTLFLPHIPFVFLFEILLLLDFFSLSLSNPLPFHCVSIYLTHFLHSSLTFSSSFLF